MSVTRRHVLALAGSGFLSKLFAASLPTLETRNSFDVDRLLAATRSLPGSPSIRKYVANATVTLLSIPIVSRSAAGSGYAVIDEAGNPQGRALSIQFGAGSWPERARGLNRLGFIQEALIEERPGEASECAWLAFMTISKENNPGQAKKALEASGTMVPYSASQGYGREGNFISRVDRLEFPREFTWRDIHRLVERARRAMNPLAAGGIRNERSSAGRPSTFLYQVHRAMAGARPRTRSALVFNGKQFHLETQKQIDVAASEYFRAKSLIASSAQVVRMNATLTQLRTGEKTPFKLWHEKGAREMPPLRFEYQARPFLRLTFEADEHVDTPAIFLAFRPSRNEA